MTCVSFFRSSRVVYPLDGIELYFGLVLQFVHASIYFCSCMIIYLLDDIELYFGFMVTIFSSFTAKSFIKSILACEYVIYLKGSEFTQDIICPQNKGF